MKFFLLALTLCLNLFAFGKDKVIVVIDPGHGGSDPGHLSHNKALKPEKDLNLSISLKFGKYIEENLINVEVHYTRKTDVYPSLDERVEMANNLNADYFISVHCNGSAKGSVYGTESHVHNWGSKKAVRLASEFEDQFENRAKRRSRGVKTGEDRGHSVQVLKYTKMTSVLVECGFVTNTSEANYLNSVYGQEIIASALYRGFRDFVKREHKDINFINTEKELTQSGEVYKIQIMSSIDPVDTDIAEFKKLGEAVERIKVESKSMYKYKYCVGKYASKKECKTLLKKVKENGFPDAYIVKFE